MKMVRNKRKLKKFKKKIKDRILSSTSDIGTCSTIGSFTSYRMLPTRINFFYIKFFEIFLISYLDSKILLSRSNGTESLIDLVRMMCLLLKFQVQQSGSPFVSSCFGFLATYLNLSDQIIRQQDSSSEPVRSILLSRSLITSYQFLSIGSFTTANSRIP